MLPIRAEPKQPRIRSAFENILKKQQHQYIRTNLIDMGGRRDPSEGITDRRPRDGQNNRCAFSTVKTFRRTENGGGPSNFASHAIGRKDALDKRLSSIVGSENRYAAVGLQHVEVERYGQFQFVTSPVRFIKQERREHPPNVIDAEQKISIGCREGYRLVQFYSAGGMRKPLQL